MENKNNTAQLGFICWYLQDKYGNFFKNGRWPAPTDSLAPEENTAPATNVVAIIFALTVLDSNRVAVRRGRWPW